MYALWRKFTGSSTLIKDPQMHWNGEESVCLPSVSFSLSPRKLTSAVRPIMPVTTNCTSRVGGTAAARVSGPVGQQYTYLLPS